MNPKKVNYIQGSYQFLTDKTSEIIWFFNLETMFLTFINPVVKLQSGYGPREIISKSIGKIIEKISFNNLKNKLSS